MLCSAAHTHTQIRANPPPPPPPTHCFAASTHPQKNHTISNKQGKEQHAYDLNAFVDGWAKVWRRVACAPRVKAHRPGRGVVDVMKEPHSKGVRREVCGRCVARGGTWRVPGGAWCKAPDITTRADQHIRRGAGNRGAGNKEHTCHPPEAY